MAAARFCLLLVLAASAANLRPAAVHLVANASNALDTDAARRHQLCKAACSITTDVTCVPQCETEMYRCVEKNTTAPYSTTGVMELSEERRECEQGVEERFKGIAGTMSFAARRAIDKDVLEHMKELCTDACSATTDSSCVPQCETEMYRCMEKNTTAPYSETGVLEASKERKECEATVQSEYREQFTHFIAKHVVDETTKKRYEKLCQEACSKTTSSSCIPECETEMYRCVEHNETAPYSETGVMVPSEARKKCEGEVKADFEKQYAAANFAAKHASTTPVKDMRSSCMEVCGTKANACRTLCEVEMYQCSDHRLPEEKRLLQYKACATLVLEKYRASVAAHK